MRVYGWGSFTISHHHAKFGDLDIAELEISAFDLLSDHNVQSSTYQKFPSEEPEEGNGDSEMSKANNRDIWRLNKKVLYLKISLTQNNWISREIGV